MPTQSNAAEAASCWPDDVQAGIYESMPSPLNWNDADRFVYLFNGYTAMDSEALETIANERFDQARRTGIWAGDVRDLWLCLFFEKRRWRHFGDEPIGADRAFLDELCESLRLKMVALDVVERAALAALMAANPCPWYRSGRP